MRLAAEALVKVFPLRGAGHSGPVPFLGFHLGYSLMAGGDGRQGALLAGVGIGVAWL